MIKDSHHLALWVLQFKEISLLSFSAFFEKGFSRHNDISIVLPVCKSHIHHQLEGKIAGVLLECAGVANTQIIPVIKMSFSSFQ